MNISKIEGIGPVIENKMREQGISTTQGLLDTCGGVNGRRQLSAATGLAEDLVLEWVNKADLMRIKGVGEEYSDLLEQSGVDTVKELRRRNATNLHAAMLAKNNEKHLVRRTPSLSAVEGWVEEAKVLSPAVSY